MGSIREARLPPGLQRQGQGFPGRKAKLCGGQEGRDREKAEAAASHCCSLGGRLRALSLGSPVEPSAAELQPVRDWSWAGFRAGRPPPQGRLPLMQRPPRSAGSSRARL